MESKNSKGLLIIVFLLVISLCTVVVVYNLKEKTTKKDEPKKSSKKKEEPTEINLGNKGSYDFDIKLLKETSKYNENSNYLISPYSIEVALNMLKVGADGNTLKEIESFLPKRDISDESIETRLGIANGLFISNRYKGRVTDKFLNTLTNDYKSEVLYDDFTSPELINNWVNEKTKGMIPKILDQMDPNFVLGIANAIALDLNWKYQFDCIDTKEGEFTKANNEKIKVEMMHNEYKGTLEYFESDNSVGVIIPYRNYDIKTGEELYEEDTNTRNIEFIGILPDNIDDYINKLDSNVINNIDKNKKEASHNSSVELGLPRFSYDYDLKEFASLLNTLGMKEAFDPANANFYNMVEKEKQFGNIYVGQAIHKTHIDLNEKGTKAAAVTYFGMFDNAMELEQTEPKEIIFNKPFIYMIRDKDTKEVLFFGTVYEPNIWKGSTCSNEEESTN